jgi:hypothetical protein
MNESDKRRTKWPFDWKTAGEILIAIADGGRLTWICGRRGVPSYNVISRWRRENAEFNDCVVFAYEDRKENIQREILHLRWQAVATGTKRSRFRAIEKELHRQIGIRYSKELSPKRDNRKCRLSINTGINTVIWKYKK